MFMLSFFTTRVLIILLTLALTGFSAATAADPPERVARLADAQGDVGFAAAGDADWGAAEINRPMIAGDRVSTDSDARAELDIGGALLRLDERSAVRIVNLDDRRVQIELSEGTLNLYVRRLFEDERYEVDTPTLAFIVTTPGEYRLDIAPRGAATSVSVFDGDGMVYGDGGTRYRLGQRRAWRFDNSRLAGYEVMDLPQPDAFDDWCFDRDRRVHDSASRRYVPEEIVGYSDLDDYGDWEYQPEYGNVWYPTMVPLDWAPYRDGRWVWIDPWGWTWMDTAPWGFAPFHYGRWIYVGRRWAWVPGPAGIRPIYAPALVVFFGGNLGVAGGGPVGWCPLGPRDIYTPPYRVSRNYFRNVNVTNIRNTTVINNINITRVYDDHSAGRKTGLAYTYRDNPAAVTVVSHDTFARARPVAKARLPFEAVRPSRDNEPGREDLQPATPATVNNRASERDRKAVEKERTPRRRAVEQPREQERHVTPPHFERPAERPVERRAPPPSRSVPDTREKPAAQQHRETPAENPPATVDEAPQRHAPSADRKMDRSHGRKDENRDDAGDHTGGNGADRQRQPLNDNARRPTPPSPTSPDCAAGRHPCP